MNSLLVSIQKDFEVIGLKSLHYYLLKNGHNSFLLYLPNSDPNDDNSLANIKKFISEIAPEFIGISLMSVEYYKACELTKYLKNNFKSIPIIWGGIHPTISPEMCLDYADYVCIGEGERSILDLANAIKNNESVKAVNNLCYIENGQIKRNMLYPLIDDLDEIPSYEHMPVNGFIQEKNGRISLLDKKVFKKHDRFKGRLYSIMSSRGCPFSCTYCCNNLTSRLYQTKKVRRRSIGNIMLDLEKAVNDNPQIEYIDFQDDCFLACSDEYLQEFCKIYKERIKKPFVIKVIPIYVNRNKIEYLKDAGLTWISFGLESGSDFVNREIYKRKSLKADFLKAAGIISNFKIAAVYDVILDNPFENESDGLETVQTLIETPKPFYPEFFSLSLYLGTELYERAKKECPEKMEDYLRKDYTRCSNNAINNMIRLSIVLSGKYMNKIVNLYKQNPKGASFRTSLFIANLLSSTIFEPLAYFRVIKLSEDGSYLRTLKALSIYFKAGITRYLNQFKKISYERKMNKKRLRVAGVLALLFIISGCITYSTQYPHISEASLSWFAHGSKNNFEDTVIKQEYQKKIGQYLLLNPQIGKEIADKMRNCKVMLGMTEEQVLLMAKPNQIIKGWSKDKKVFKYSDVGKFGWSKFVGEGIRVSVTLRNGVVTDISELDTIIGH